MVNFADIQAAAARIAGKVHRTPVLTCATIDGMAGAQLFFKCENLQKVGAFKMRGATNAVFSLAAEEAARGVATHSSGNHAQALALAARLRGVPAYVVMPSTAPAVKRAAVADYGAEIITCEPTLAARESTLKEVVARTGAAFVHPYDNDDIIAGQGTAALELLTDYPDLEVVMAPVGGGGLLSGTALATRALAPRAEIIAAEPEGADDAFRSLAAGQIIPSEKPNTVADGLLTSLGVRNFPIIQEHVSAIWLVDDPAIVAAMRLVWERMKIIIEPSSAVCLAAVLARPELVAGKRIGMIISGGNVDLGRLPW
ncbi:MAG: pyridoxal-phosphate dependent enzyme [Candidatus Krumholzibacteria bacterium]|nr:pyridoxal-phosphate dependent enzyme [Candidatus Krumholzibacteria bacterium]